MREIKFRGKREDNGEWVYGDLIQNPNTTGKCLIIERGVTSYSSTNEAIKEYLSESYIEIIPETLCQCTGLQDRDGKDIFENDIVEINDKFDGIFETNVVFKNGCFGIDMSVVKQIKNPNGWDKNYDKCESFGMNTSKYKTLTKENSDMISGYGYHTDNCKIIKNKFDKEED